MLMGSRTLRKNVSRLIQNQPTSKIYASKKPRHTTACWKVTDLVTVWWIAVSNPFHISTPHIAPLSSVFHKFDGALCWLSDRSVSLTHTRGRAQRKPWAVQNLFGVWQQTSVFAYLQCGGATRESSQESSPIGHHAEWKFWCVLHPANSGTKRPLMIEFAGAASPIFDTVQTERRGAVADDLSALQITQYTCIQSWFY